MPTPVEDPMVVWEVWRSLKDWLPPAVTLPVSCAETPNRLTFPDVVKLPSSVYVRVELVDWLVPDWLAQFALMVSISESVEKLVSSESLSSATGISDCNWV